MQVSLLGTESNIRSLVPVQLLVAVDGKIVRAAIDWETIKHLLSADSIDETLVRDFIRKRRPGLELAIKAHLFSRGVPLDRQLSLGPEELGGLQL
jgi:hypothetical protein